VLVVVGDVSGKGPKAAMTVSAIMGALHDYSSSRPANVLAHLNRVLHGRVSGFVTCCATLIAADGTMALANAGNPAPYRNGQEMAVQPGLPLGVLEAATYDETHYQIAPGDRITFVSDGVIEATSSTANSMASTAPRPSATSPRRPLWKQSNNSARKTTSRSSR
jgi:sigma-B regulation protein RsbU (phosphoserine phosphatase)